MSIKNINIEKFNITSFEKEHKPYTVIPTDVIQRSKNTRAAFLWIFFQSLPDTWIPNKSHITQHFDISDRTYERWLSWLNATKLIEYRQDRKKDGSFGGWRLVILNGLQFNPDAESNRCATIGGTAVIRKKSGQVVQLNRSANLPLNGEPVATAFGGHINTTEIFKKARVKKHKNNKSIAQESNTPAQNDIPKETRSSSIVYSKEYNKGAVEDPVLFSSSNTVRTHLLEITASRNVFLEEETIEQVMFYIGADLHRETVKKKINVALKLIREGKWNIPHGFKGITSQSIREKEEQHEREKKALYEQEAKVMQQIRHDIKCGIRPSPMQLIFGKKNEVA